MQRRVVITGANRGLGRALTELFLKGDWQVIAVTRRGADMPVHPNLRTEHCELANSASLVTLISNLEGVAVDVLINNAAIYDSEDVDAEQGSADFDLITNVFQVNTIAPKLLADGLLPNLLAGKSRLLITISSGMGTYAEFEEYHAQHWAYSASKAAVNYAMVSFAGLHPDIVTALINPGWMQTGIGGAEAPLSPETSAAKIYDLIVKRPHKLLNARIVDYHGKPMDF